MSEYTERVIIRDFLCPICRAHQSFRLVARQAEFGVGIVVNWRGLRCGSEIQNTYSETQWIALEKTGKVAPK
jgi:hypothetical protein